MHEVELRFQVPVEMRAAVDAAVAGRTPQRRMRLQAAYVDTPERALAAAGLALRVRREGRQWVQTLKGAADDGMTRLEHNVMLAAAPGTVPSADPQRHAGTPAGERLLALLAKQPAAALQVLYRSDIRRRSRMLRSAQGSVELCFDEGQILAGDRKLSVCELEIELKGGSPQALIATARRWVPRFGLWLDTRTKAERGDRLSRGEALSPARVAQPVRLTEAMTPPQALGVVLRCCADQVWGNASQIGSGAFDAEHVHQLRVGLRRLRSALRLFGSDVAGDAGQTLSDAAAAVFRRLGGARDQAVLQGAFAADLQAALHSVAADTRPFLLAPDAQTESPVDVVRDGATQALLLDLLAACGEAAGMGLPRGALAESVEPGAVVPLRDLLAKRLSRWHRDAAADARRFAELDDAARHVLRKHVKRLRYAVEFSASLFERRAVRAYLRPLRALQERLGALNDAVMAVAALRDRIGSDAQPVDARAWFVLGWLAARRDDLVAGSAPDLAAFAKAKRFWKGRG